MPEKPLLGEAVPEPVVAAEAVMSYPLAADVGLPEAAVRVDDAPLVPMILGVTALASLLTNPHYVRAFLIDQMRRLRGIVSRSSDETPKTTQTTQADS